MNGKGSEPVNPFHPELFRPVHPETVRSEYFKPARPEYNIHPNASQAHSEASLGYSNTSPGQSNTSPGNFNTSPGFSNTSPGHSNISPGHTNISPVYSNISLGFSNISPGVSNTAPSHPDLSPTRNLSLPLPEAQLDPVKYKVHQPDASVPPAATHLLGNSIYPNIEVKRYSTAALDPCRHFLTVYEYPLNGHSVVWDYETGYVHLTGIWKAAIHHPDNDLPKSNSKADIVRLLDSTPRQHQSKIKRIRGGFLKIQGTWLPYALCRILARRFCYHIRFQLIPVFGALFPSDCFLPTDPGYGELKLDELEDVESPVTPPRTTTSSVLTPDRLVRWNSVVSLPESSLSYNEVVDIVNASKCLQLLSQSAQTSPICYDRRELREYTTVSDSGISSILLAADISSRPKENVQAPELQKIEPRRASVKINDLLS